MIKNTLSITLVLATFLFSSMALAEEPYIGIGAVQHTYEQDFGNENDFEAEPTSYRITIGSRVARYWIMEAYYLAPLEEDDEVFIGTGGNTGIEVEYEAILGYSVNASYKAGPFLIYGGPHITAARIVAESTNPSIDSFNDKDTRVSGGLGAGVSIVLFDKVSLNVNGQTYYWDSDILGTGVGAELRYHL
jgi:opacity protein-like surface antigen